MKTTPYSWLNSKNIDRLLLILVILLVFSVPLSFTTSTYAFFEPLKLTLFRSITVLCVGLFLTRSLLSSELKAQHMISDLPLLLLVVAGAGTTLWSINRHISLWGDLYRYDGYVTLLSCVFLFYLCASLFRSRKSSELFFQNLVLVTFLVSTYGIIQSLGYDFIRWDPGVVDVSRVFSTFGNPAYLAAFLVLSTPVILAYVLSRPLRSAVSLLFLVAPVLSFVCLVLTQTRAAWLAALLSLALLAFLDRDVLRQKKKHLQLMGILFLALVFSIAVLSGQPSTFFDRFRNRATTALNPSATLGSRIQLWETSLRMVKARPLLGSGFDTFRIGHYQYQTADDRLDKVENAIPDKAHNDILQVSVGQGLIGLCLYLWFLIAFLWKNFLLYRDSVNLPEKTIKSGLLTGVFGYLFYIQFNFNVISVLPLFWIVLGFTSNYLVDEAVQMQTSSYKNPFNAIQPSTKLSIVFLLDLFFIIMALSSLKLLTADRWAKNGFEHKKAGVWLEAAADFRMASSYNPDESRYLIWLGEVSVYQFFADNDLASKQNALIALKKARQLDPLEKEVYWQLGNLYLRQGQTSGKSSFFTSAITNFKHILRLDPYDLDGYLNLSIAYARSGQLDQAIAALVKAVEYDPGFWQAYSALAQLYEQTGETKKAESFYKRSVQAQSLENRN